jgi:multidrug resistance efflux pump
MVNSEWRIQNAPNALISSFVIRYSVFPHSLGDGPPDMKRLWIIVPLAIAAIAVLLWSQQRAAPFFVSGFIEAEEIRLGSRIGGRVERVLVEEGRAVSAGQALIVLEPYDLRERLAQAQAVLAAREATLSRLRAGFRQEEIEQARARRERYQAILDRLVAGRRPLEISMLEHKLAIAEAEMRDAQREYERVRPLAERGEAAQNELERARYALEARRAAVALARDELALAREGTRQEEIAEARAMLAEAAASLALLEAGSRSEEVDQAQAEVEAARSELAAVQRQLDELVIAAPRDAMVEALDLQPGDLIAPNAPVISLIDPRSLYVRAYVPENRLNVSLGQRVWVRVDSLAGRHFPARIAFISRQAEFTPSNVQTPEERSKQVFRIKVLLEAGHDVLRAGMSADVLFEAPRNTMQAAEQTGS